MSTVLTPVMLRVLVHHFYLREDLNGESIAVDDAHTALSHQGLLDRDDQGCWIVTERGRVHVATMCSLPLPVQKWVAA